MADPSDLTQAFVALICILSNYQCLSVDMGAKQHLQIQGVSSQEQRRISKKNDCPDI